MAGPLCIALRTCAALLPLALAGCILCHAFQTGSRTDVDGAGEARLVLSPDEVLRLVKP
jgi:hypothetical protein